MGKYCNRCGTKLDPGRSFCPGCGAQVSAQEVPQGGASAGVGAPVPPMPPTPGAAGIPAPAAPTSSMPPVPSAPVIIPAVAPGTPAMGGASPISPMPAPAAPMAGTPAFPGGAPVPPSPINPAQTTPNAKGKPGKGKRIAIIVIAVLAAIALILGILGIIGSRNAADGASKESGAQSQSQEPADTKNTDADGKSDAKKFSFDKTKLDAIANGAQPAAVALSTTDGGAEYASSSAGESKVASGLYLPVYLAATDNGKNPDETASTMLKSMDNDAANQLIDRIGGTGKVNDWLKQNGYGHTELQRKYGDTAASAAGKENMTTAQDAANMLAVMDRIDAAKLMAFDAKKAGVTVPESMTVYGHTGQGIKDARNFFLVIKDGDRTVTVVVMTDGQSQETVAATVTKLLAELHAEVNPDGKGTGNQNGGSGNGSGSGSGDKGGSDKGTVAPVQLTQSYTTQYGTVNAVTLPSLSFGYPAGWTITEDTVNQSMEHVTLTNTRGVEVTYFYSFDGNRGGCGRMPWSANITKVSDASFNAPAVQANAYNLGPFMVASFGDGMYALLPESMQGTHDYSGLPVCNLLFDWPSKYATSFLVTNSKEGLNEQEKREVIAILASLRGA